MRKTISKRLTKFLFLRVVGKPTTLQEIRMTFYRGVLINMFWVEGDLPNNLEQKFDFVINPSWETTNIPKNTRGLRHLSEELLSYLYARLKRPDWVDKPKVVKISMSLNEVVKQWPFLFDLSK